MSHEPAFTTMQTTKETPVPSFSSEPMNVFTGNGEYRD